MTHGFVVEVFEVVDIEEVVEIGGFDKVAADIEVIVWPHSSNYFWGDFSNHGVFLNTQAYNGKHVQSFLRHYRSHSVVQFFILFYFIFGGSPLRISNTSTLQASCLYFTVNSSYTFSWNRFSVSASMDTASRFKNGGLLPRYLIFLYFKFLKKKRAAT